MTAIFGGLTNVGTKLAFQMGAVSAFGLIGYRNGVQGSISGDVFNGRRILGLYSDFSPSIFIEFEDPGAVLLQSFFRELAYTRVDSVGGRQAYQTAAAQSFFRSGGKTTWTFVATLTFASAFTYNCELSS